MPDELCPMCGTRRIGSFRYCRTCRFDFDAPMSQAPGQAPTRRRRRATSGPGFERRALPSIRLVAGAIAIIAATLLGVGVVIALQLAGRI